jgi:hypothetical protein
MQTLGLSDSTPRTEARLKNLFWPSILNEVDVDYLGRQGFWVCFGVAAVTLIFNLVSGFIVSGMFESLFFFLGGVGVRSRSRFAAVVIFSAYFLSTLVGCRHWMLTAAVRRHEWRRGTQKCVRYVCLPRSHSCERIEPKAKMAAVCFGCTGCAPELTEMRCF